jgi:TRAP-type transport system small permease protein
VKLQSDARPSGLRRLVEMLMALTLAAMVVAVFINVVLRYAFNTGIVSYEELSRLLFVWLVCIGAVVASAEGKHLGFDMLTARLRGIPARLLSWFSGALVLYCLALVIKGSWEQVLAGTGTTSAVIGYPMALAAAPPLVMAAGMAVLLVRDLVLGLPAPSELHLQPEAIVD